MFEDKIKSTKTFSSCEILILLSLYVYILYQVDFNNLSIDFSIFYKKYLKYKREINVFIQKNNYCKQHNYILLLSDYLSQFCVICYNIKNKFILWKKREKREKREKKKRK